MKYAVWTDENGEERYDFSAIADAATAAGMDVEEADQLMRWVYESDPGLSDPDAGGHPRTASELIQQWQDDKEVA